MTVQEVEARPAKQQRGAKAAAQATMLQVAELEAGWDDELAEAAPAAGSDNDSPPAARQQPRPRQKKQRVLVDVHSGLAPYRGSAVAAGEGGAAEAALEDVDNEYERQVGGRPAASHGCVCGRRLGRQLRSNVPACLPGAPTLTAPHQHAAHWPHPTRNLPGQRLERIRRNEQMLRQLGVAEAAGGLAAAVAAEQAPPPRRPPPRPRERRAPAPALPLPSRKSARQRGARPLTSDEAVAAAVAELGALEAAGAAAGAAEADPGDGRRRRAAQCSLHALGSARRSPALRLGWAAEHASRPVGVSPHPRTRCEAHFPSSRDCGAPRARPPRRRCSLSPTAPRWRVPAPRRASPPAETAALLDQETYFQLIGRDISGAIVSGARPPPASAAALAIGRPAAAAAAGARSAPSASRLRALPTRSLPPTARMPGADGRFRGWVSPAVCERYGIAGDPDAAWEAGGGGQFSFKIDKSGGWACGWVAGWGGLLACCSSGCERCQELCCPAACVAHHAATTSTTAASGCSHPGGAQGARLERRARVQPHAAAQEPQRLLLPPRGAARAAGTPVHPVCGRAWVLGGGMGARISLPRGAA